MYSQCGLWHRVIVYQIKMYMSSSVNTRSGCTVKAVDGSLTAMDTEALSMHRGKPMLCAMLHSMLKPWQEKIGKKLCCMRPQPFPTESSPIMM